MDFYDKSKSKNNESSTTPPTLSAHASGDEEEMTCMSDFYPEHINAIVREIINAIEGAGLTRDATDLTQLSQAIQASNPMKARARYDGDADTIAGSYGIASITKNGTGDYTVTFTAPLEDDNYSVSVFCNYLPDTGNNNHIPYIVSQSASSFRFEIWRVNNEGDRGNQTDSSIINISVLR